MYSLSASIRLAADYDAQLDQLARISAEIVTLWDRAAYDADALAELGRLISPAQ